MSINNENISHLEKTDEELIRHVRSGDHKAMIVFYRRHELSVRRSVDRVLGPDLSKDAEDIAQEVFDKAVQDWQPTTGSSSARGWLIVAARNASLNHRKLKVVRRDMSVDPTTHSAFEQGVEGPPTPEEQLAAQESDKAVRQFVADSRDLSVHQKDAIELCIFEGLTYEEAARRLGVTSKAVELRLARGLEALRVQKAKLRGLLAFMVAIGTTTVGKDSEATPQLRDRPPALPELSRGVRLAVGTVTLTAVIAIWAALFRPVTRSAQSRGEERAVQDSQDMPRIDDIRTPVKAVPTRSPNTSIAVDTDAGALHVRRATADSEWEEFTARPLRFHGPNHFFPSYVVDRPGDYRATVTGETFTFQTDFHEFRLDDERRMGGGWALRGEHAEMVRITNVPSDCQRDLAYRCEGARVGRNLLMLCMHLIRCRMDDSIETMSGRFLKSLNVGRMLDNTYAIGNTWTVEEPSGGFYGGRQRSTAAGMWQFQSGSSGEFCLSEASDHFAAVDAPLIARRVCNAHPELTACRFAPFYSATLHGDANNDRRLIFEVAGENEWNGSMSWLGINADDTYSAPMSCTSAWCEAVIPDGARVFGFMATGQGTVLAGRFMQSQEGAWYFERPSYGYRNCPHVSGGRLYSTPFDRSLFED